MPLLWMVAMKSVDALIDRLGLKANFGIPGAIEKIVDEVIANNPKNVEEFPRR